MRESNMSIPKTIHYCWFGGNAMPKMLQFCMASWKEHLPEYQFVLWNEQNTHLDCEFVKQAYNEKRWAFVSDYIRLKAVYEYGGIYLDTDMLLTKPLDDFLENDCFFVAEHESSIGVGVFGAVKKHPFILTCLTFYQQSKVKVPPIPKVITDAFLESYNFSTHFRHNIFREDIAIYKPTYFYALPYTKYYDIHHYKNYVTTASYGVHLWYGSWHDYDVFVYFRRKEFLNGFKELWKLFLKGKLFKPRYLKKVLVALKDGLVTRNAFK
ncbi:hypothetical protein GSB9_00190 [Flavobacteriaceae bacterium GSB9]|nr:hypothetical protein GSB9_00190 [Flavobacteriaceae bacterium GSB9]